MSRAVVTATVATVATTATATVAATAAAAVTTTIATAAAPAITATTATAAAASITATTASATAPSITAAPPTVSTAAATAASSTTTSPFLGLNTRHPGQAVRNQYGRRREDCADGHCEHELFNVHIVLRLCCLDWERGCALFLRVIRPVPEVSGYSKPVRRSGCTSGSRSPRSTGR
ncbi:exported hypothetical protein [Pseudomonas sp. IT-P2]